jgi:cellulose synthase (UDP-forming)
MKKLLHVLIGLGFLSTLYYFAWWFEQEHIFHPALFILFVAAVIYTVVQVYCAWYIFLHAKHVRSREAPPGLSVDVFVPTYDEPLWLVERMLRAAIAIRYPHQTYLIDDGHKTAYRELAERLGARYLSRPTNEDNKAGNVNYALMHSPGEFVAIFDIDHAPQPDYLDRSLGHFDDPQIGFVQVMLSHDNDAESFVAGAASQRNNGFFGAPMLGLNGIGCAQAFGSNCIFRRQALESIGGYKPGLAEDLHTSIRLHAVGWRSAYVPETLAQGLEPADLASFFKQQLKWSRGVFTLLKKNLSARRETAEFGAEYRLPLALIMLSGRADGGGQHPCRHSCSVARRARHGCGLCGLSGARRAIRFHGWIDRLRRRQKILHRQPFAQMHSFRRFVPGLWRLADFYVVFYL